MRRVGQVRMRDKNEPEIVNALRRVGVFVVQISGKDAPDLLTCYRGQWLPLEVKASKHTPVTAGQIAAGYPIVRSISEAFQALGIQA